MATIRALIAGVSNYSALNQPNLPFCINDIYAINTALIEGLKVDPANITMCGVTGCVLGTDLLAALQQLSIVSKEDDTLLIYFSGHGSTISDNHYLVLSDTLFKTQELVTYLDKVPARIKVLFLDCCMASMITEPRYWKRRKQT